MLLVEVLLEKLKAGKRDDLQQEEAGAAEEEEVQLLCATLSDHSPFIPKESLRMSGKR